MTNLEKVSLKLSVTTREIADRIGISEQEMTDKLTEGSFMLCESVKIADYLNDLGAGTSVKELFQ